MATTPDDLNKVEVTTDEMMILMLLDLANEMTHMHHYLLQAAVVAGLHRAHLKPLFSDEAESEMGHVKAFSDKIVAAGGGLKIPDVKHYPVTACLNPKDAIQKSIDLEAEVCDNYALRIDQCNFLYEKTKTAFWRAQALFYEEQLEHSQTDLDNFRQIVWEG